MHRIGAFTVCLLLTAAGCRSSASWQGHTDAVVAKGAGMNTRVTPFLMFQGNAQQAMEFYVSLFPDSRVEEVKLYGPGEAGQEGTVERAVFVLAGQRVMCFDSSVQHEFTFTPASSLFVDCSSEAEIDTLFSKLSEGGNVMMPLDNYGFSQRFGFCADRFGVSWQLNLPSN